MKTIKLTQYQLQRLIVDKTGINVVTCGMCGNTILHLITDEEITCPYPICNYTSEPCDFPDLN